MTRALFGSIGLVYLAVVVISADGIGDASEAKRDKAPNGRRLFVHETFGGNGRTCQTCHSEKTGTVSPDDARRRFRIDRDDPLFLHDGSDDGQGNGVRRMLTDATVLVTVPLAANVTLADDPDARTVTVRRGIPTTLNTPALDPVLMVDGRQPDLRSQAVDAIRDHAQGGVPTFADAEAIAAFQQTRAFFSSSELWWFARGGPAPRLPQGRTAAERRGRRFFEDLPPNPADGLKGGLCAHCHSGPLLNTTNAFAAPFIPSPAPVPEGQRFISVGVSEFNTAGNPTRTFVFNAGSPAEVRLTSPDPGRALVTGVVDDPTLEHVNAFKISALRGIRHTAPYFHDNSARTLAEVASHYATFFRVASGGLILLTPQDERDIVAYMMLLD
jgi:cytochrome c peroxidase